MKRAARFMCALFAALFLLYAVVFLGVLPLQLVKAMDIPFTATPADVGLAYEEVSIAVPSDDLSLSAWWMPAEDAGSVVLFVQGANSNKEEEYFGGLAYYAALVAHGHHVLAIDLRNHGASDRTTSGRLTFGREEHRDVLAALDWLEARAPGLPIIGSGVSMGGAVLIEAAARDPRLLALVLVDPLLELRSAILEGAHAQTGLPRLLIELGIWSAVTFFGLAGEGAPLFDRAMALTTPTLIVQDPDDPVTQASFARRLAATNAHVLYHEVPPVAADHPLLAESGRWGSHARAFRIFGPDVLNRVESFLSSRQEWTLK